MYAIDLPEGIKAKLLPYQWQHVANLTGILRNHKRAGDFSEMGTGKTSSGLATASLLGKKPFVCCPLAAVSTWFYWSERMKIPLYGVANYEKLHNQRFYSAPGVVEDCPFVQHAELKDLTSNPFASKKKKDKTVTTFRWKLPDDALLVFDEVHKCKNRRTLNSILLFAAANTNASILLLSGTACDTPEGFELIGYVLNLYPNTRSAKSWLAHKSVGYQNPMEGVHRALYPERAQRLRVKDLAGFFPENTIICDPYEMETAKEIEELYQIIAAEVERLKNKEEGCGNALAKIIFACMRIEQLKVPRILEMAKELVREGTSVAIFINFTNTLKCLAEELNTKCLVYGEQSAAEREANVASFQADKERIIICNIKSGGVGLSLHDTKGNYPRAAIISPTYSALDMGQVLKRIHRSGGKTPCRQWLLLCAGTVEEKVGERLREKLMNIDYLNDGDLGALHIPGLHEQERIECPEENIVENKKMEVLLMKRTRLLNELQEVQDEIDKITKKKKY